MIDNHTALASTPVRSDVLTAISDGVTAAHPASVVPTAVGLEDGILRVGEARYEMAAFDEVRVIGGGKGAEQVVLQLEAILGDTIAGGVVVSLEGAPSEYVSVRRGGHPVPTEAGVRHTRAVLEAASAADADTLLIGVITGGASALLTAPAAGITRADIAETTDQLLRAGASIHELNAVRKHLSAIKGGRLAERAAPATVACIVLSDVVGNDLDVIASGPFVPDTTDFAEAAAVIDRYAPDAPAAVIERLQQGRTGAVDEHPPADSPVFDRVHVEVIADGMTAMQATAAALGDAGYRCLLLSSRIRGEATAMATTHVGVAEEIAATGIPIEPPAAIISGGEATVNVRGDGSGGPNLEFVLSAVMQTDLADATIAAIDTDGIDGVSGVAGGIVDVGAIHPDLAREALARNDALPLLMESDGIIETGPTGTNVNDLRVIVVPEQAG